MKVLVINPIMYTSETKNIKRAASIKDTMMYDFCLAFHEMGHSVTLVGGEPFKPTKSETYPFEVLWWECKCQKVCMPHCLPFMPETYRYEPIHAGKGWKNAIVTWYQKFKESVFFRKLFFLAFVTSLILFRTLLNRNFWMNPLSDVMGGWDIWGTVNGEQKLTTECIENVIMMMPFSAVVMWTFEEKIGNGWKKILWQSGKIAFIFSISIEMLQLLLRLGTFQLSDIFYNTVGGMIGGLMYCAVMKVRKRL